MRLLSPSMYGRMRLLQKILVKSQRLAVMGCGEGDNVFDFQNCSTKIHCFDINFHDISVAKISLDSSICVSQQDIQHIAYHSSCFDTIVCLETLEHVPHIPQAVQEIARVTKKKGQVIISVPNRHFSFFNDPLNYCLNLFFGKRIPLGVYGFGHTVLYTEDEMRAFLEPYFIVHHCHVINKACVGIVENYIPSFLQIFVKENTSNSFIDSSSIHVHKKQYTISFFFHYFYSFVHALDAFFCSKSSRGQTLVLVCERR